MTATLSGVTKKKAWPSPQEQCRISEPASRSSASASADRGGTKQQLGRLDAEELLSGEPSNSYE